MPLCYELKSMKNFVKVLNLSMIVLLFSCATSHKTFAVDLNQVETELKGAGAVGWIHGSVESQGIYVFTYRNPTNFFDYVEMSLTSSDPAIQKQFASLSRHDQVRVKGDYLPMPTVPQKHIGVTSIELVKKYDSGYAVDPYQHQVKIPDALLNLTTATFLVHAVAAGGAILVVEYQDAVLPIFVKNTTLTQNLYRGDIVTLNFKIQAYPNEPVHLNLNETAPDAVKVLDSILALHQKPADIQGSLILFPKSPEITLNVFAVQAQMPASLMRQYTLVNMDDPQVFNDILKKCQAAWDKYPGQYVNGRNKLVSKRLQVKVKGVFNEVDPSQSNAQILIKSADDVEIVEN
jgi:hypothetical protein